MLVSFRPDLIIAQGSYLDKKPSQETVVCSIQEERAFLPRDCTLCWRNSLPTRLGQSGQLHEPGETEKPEETSESRGLEGGCK